MCPSDPREAQPTAQEQIGDWGCDVEIPLKIDCPLSIYSRMHTLKVIYRQRSATLS